MFFIKHNIRVCYSR